MGRSASLRRPTTQTLTVKNMNEQIILLQEIKSALWLLIYLVGIGVAFNILRAVFSSYRTIKNELENAFYTTTSAMFENGDYDEVIEHCNKHLKKKPKEAYGYWFLGKAHFQKKEYEKAKSFFIKTIEIYPTWEEEWVSPYLNKIDAAINTANKASQQTPKSGAAKL